MPGVFLPRSGCGDPRAADWPALGIGPNTARAFGKRPLVEDNRVEGKSTFLVNAGIGYRKKNGETAVECLSLFNRPDHDIEYDDASRLPGGDATGVRDGPFHPAEPRMFRLRVTYPF